MKKYIIYLALIAFTGCMPELVYAGNDNWKKTLEQKYIDSGVEGSEPYISSETYFFYDENNNLVLSIVPEDQTRITYIYDELGHLSAKTIYTYNEDDRSWKGSVMTEYNYYADGNLKTAADRYFDWETGAAMAPGMYKIYLYGQNGELTKEEDRVYESDKLIGFKEYTYDSGLKRSVKSYILEEDGAETLSEQTDYSYNGEGLLAEEISKTLQYSIDPSKLTNLGKKMYTYENGTLTEMISYSPGVSDNEVWLFAQKHNYRFDTDSKKMVTDILFNANNNMETGEFISWMQLIRTEYRYSDKLGADKTPKRLEGTADGDGVRLSWEAPGNIDGLTGYNIFRDYQLLETIPVPVGSNRYTDSNVKKDLSYEYFIQPVYNEKELMNISPVIAVTGQTVGVSKHFVPTIVSVVNSAVEMQGNGLRKVEIFKADGTLAVTRNLDGDRAVVGGFAQGVYLVKVTSREGEYKQKVSIR